MPVRVTTSHSQKYGLVSFVFLFVCFLKGPASPLFFFPWKELRKYAQTPL